MDRQASGRSRSIRTIGTAAVAAAVGLLAVAVVGAGAASGQNDRAAQPSAQSAAKKRARRCRGRIRNARRRRDCRDLRIGNPQSPRRQRYDGRRIPTRLAGRCDLFDRAICLQPWPNDYFTVKAATPTGRRLHLNRRSTAANASGVHIDPTDLNRSDGFSPGQLIVVRVPGLDNAAALRRTNPVGLTNLHAYARRAAPIVVINARTGKRQPIWVELDRNAPNPRSTNIEIRAAVNYEEGTRYIVALRNLRNRRGRVLAARKVFRLYRDRLITRQRPIERRRARMEFIFRRLRRSGIRRGNLYLAWDFTVGSAQSIAGRVLAMRDDAFAQLGDTDLDNYNPNEGDPPEFQIDAVETNVDAATLRRIDGKVTVPCYLSHPTADDQCDPGARFAFSGPNDLTPNRVPNASTDVPFRCVIPRSVVDLFAVPDPVVVPARPTLFGHGLLGNRFSVDGTDIGANENNMVICAMNWDGFSSDDVNTGIYPSLTDLSNFPRIADGVQQAFVNFLYLGRALVRPDGFRSVEAFQVDPDNPEDAVLDPNADGDSVGATEAVIDTSNFSATRNALSYFGVSHGGIMGGALTALAPDHQRAVLNVPAMNHSTLLERSIHWDTYGPVFNASYKRPITRPQILSMIQILWDRAENDGFAHHMTGDHYANTPPHTILMQVAYGDHQVTNYAAEVMARTIGARILTPALPAGRHWDSNPFLGIPAIGSPPYSGSAIVYWDGGPLGYVGHSGPGTAAPPLLNRPPRAADGYGGDPHGYILGDFNGRKQLSDFLQLGTLTDCGGFPPPCRSNNDAL